MLKKNNLMIIIITIILLMGSAGQAAEAYIDKSNLNNGTINVSLNGKAGAVRITKGTEKYDHILKGNDSIPLSLGNGDYTIQVLESVGGNKYKQIEKEVVTLKLANSNDVYLQSIQKINWNKDMNAVKKAKELTKDSKTDKEKIEAIYEYIISNIGYDYDIASKITAGTIKDYSPVIDNVLKAQKGICYDYASLFAGMLRSLDIPTKLVMGNKNDVAEYHAWNQVYLQDTNEWITIDTTYDAGMKKGNAKVTMIKNASEYKIAKEY